MQQIFMCKFQLHVCTQHIIISSAALTGLCGTLFLHPRGSVKSLASFRTSWVCLLSVENWAGHNFAKRELIKC